ncbi:hypothetical protein [Streptomyces sp. NPDC005898]|uniref:hypothetical protein n=1 Tax=Streptomyces sp. NPDC005898 TaxID=3157082 RepID=UPI0033D07EE8
MSTSDAQQPGPDEGEPLSSVETSRRARRHRAAIDRPAAEKFREQLLDLITEHERQVVAERALAGDPNPTDADPLEYVYEIAEHYAQSEGRPGYLAQLADELTLDDVRALRLAGEAAKAATPLVVLAESSRGKEVPQIAGEVGLTESRVYAILREQRAADPDGLNRWDAFWTIERRDDGEWHELAAQSSKRKDRPDVLARYLLAREQHEQPAGVQLRVRVWKFGTSDTAPPLAEVTTGQQ